MQRLAIPTILMSEAKKMVASGEFYLMHIEWDRDLEKKHPDCSHFIVPAGRYWRKTKEYAAVVKRPKGEISPYHISEETIDVMLPLAELRMQYKPAERVFPIAFFSADDVRVNPLEIHPSTEIADFSEARRREYPSCRCDYHTPRYTLSCTYGEGVGYHWYRVCNVCGNMAARPMSERESDNFQMTREDKIVMSPETYSKLLRAKIIYHRLNPS